MTRITILWLAAIAIAFTACGDINIPTQPDADSTDGGTDASTCAPYCVGQQAYGCNADGVPVIAQLCSGGAVCSDGACIGGGDDTVSDSSDTGGTDVPVTDTPEADLPVTDEGGKDDVPADPGTSDPGTDQAGDEGTTDPGTPDPGGDQAGDEGTTDSGPDTVCVPDCNTAVCGPDGCGGSCGSCTGNQEVCTAGACMCQPACDGLECGPDGCGGSCGSCAANETCDNGQCDCVPDCSGKDCGSDGCGGTCGSCINDEVCSAGSCTCPCLAKACTDYGFECGQLGCPAATCSLDTTGCGSPDQPWDGWNLSGTGSGVSVNIPATDALTGDASTNGGTAATWTEIRPGDSGLVGDPLYEALSFGGLTFSLDLIPAGAVIVSAEVWAKQKSVDGAAYMAGDSYQKVVLQHARYTYLGAVTSPSVVIDQAFDSRDLSLDPSASWKNADVTEAILYDIATCQDQTQFRMLWAPQHQGHGDQAINGAVFHSDNAAAAADRPYLKVTYFQK